jgi:hypothetical protein
VRQIAGGKLPSEAIQSEAVSAPDCFVTSFFAMTGKQAMSVGDYKRVRPLELTAIHRYNLLYIIKADAGRVREGIVGE